MLSTWRQKHTRWPPVICVLRRRLSNGYHGDPKRKCRCAPLQVQRYRERISGPLLDRIEIHLEVGALTYHEMAGIEPGERIAPFEHS